MAGRSRVKQLSFYEEASFKRFNRREHGHDVRKGLRKEYRPYDSKRPVHLVLRSERARGKWSMLNSKHERRIKHLAYSLAAKWRVKIYQYANSGNHLHLIVRGEHDGFKGFLRTFSGLVARAVTGAKKGEPKGPFWDGLAFTRVMEWGQDFFRGKDYVILNEMESVGVWHREWSRTTKESKPRIRGGPQDLSCSSVRSGATG